MKKVRREEAKERRPFFIISRAVFRAVPQLSERQEEARFRQKTEPSSADPLENQRERENKAENYRWDRSKFINKFS